MDDFRNNYCRICTKVFCCKKCKEKHEKKVHNIFPDCDICLYGKQVLSVANEPFLKHLKSSHWPLHCIFCNRIFGSTEDLLLHKKCPVGYKENSPKSPYGHTPVKPCFDYDSPPVIAFDEQFLATSSTPMQRGEEPNLFLKTFKEVITPVDYSGGRKSIIKKTDSNPRENSLKRRVTFCETPITNNKNKMFSTSQEGIEENQKSINIIKSTMENLLQSDKSSSTPSGCITGTFYSIKESPIENNEDDNKKEEKDIDKKINYTEEEDYKENKENLKEIVDIDEEEIVNIEKDEDPKETDNTFWVSATNLSIPDDNTEEKPANNHTGMATDKPANIHLATPKHKLVSVVMPTPFIKRKPVKVHYNGPQLYSTPIASASMITTLADSSARTTTSVQPSKSKNMSANNLDLQYSPTGLAVSEPIKSDPQICKVEIDFRKHEISIQEMVPNEHDPKEKVNISENNGPSDDNMHNNSLWTSMTKMVKHVIQGFTSSNDISSIGSCSAGNSLKRSFSFYDSNEGPNTKRYKLTEIKCRRTIREIFPTAGSSKNLANEEFITVIQPIENDYQKHINNLKEVKYPNNTNVEEKKYVDKSTQTDY